MNNIISDTHEENDRLNLQITDILSENLSCRQTEKKLKELQKTVSAPLSVSHVQYYINQIRAQRYALYKRIIAAPFCFAYTFCMLHQMYYIIYPDKPHYNLPFTLSNAQWVFLFFLAPAFFLLYFLIRYFIFEKE